MAAVIYSCAGSDGLEEVTEGAGKTEESVYQDVNDTRKVVYDLYGRVRELKGANHGTFSRLKTMNTCVALLDNATDDGIGEMGSTVAGIVKYVTGSISATSNPVVDTHPWTWYYTAIRQANGFLENVDASVLEATEKAHLKAEARFLRAYYYHELYRWFGRFVILDHRVDPFDKSLKRATEKECVDWLIGEFDALIAPGSGLQDVPESNYYGIATRGAAYAYKARTLLYAASPLHADAGSGATWAQAAQAAKDMIDWSDDNGYYDLYVDPSNPAMSYAHLFNTRYNNEYIFWYNNADANDIYHLFPPVNPWNVNKELASQATVGFVDSYDMIDGTSPFIYDEYGHNLGANPACTTYDPDHPYDNRDPRLDQTILHDGMTWPLVGGSPCTLDISTKEKWVAGHFICKFLDERVDHIAGGKVTMNFPCMRFAEMLLDYAEAINETANTPAVRAEAAAALNRIRNRAGITTPLDPSEFTQKEMRIKIRQERRIELSWEEHRFFDIRRWKIANVVMNESVKGITKDAATGKYSFIQYGKRTYSPRMDLSPIPVKDVNQCPGIDQNPGY